MAKDLDYIKAKKRLEKVQENTDKVNHPSHYQKGGKECIQVMLETFGIQAVINFCELNAFKYEWRAGMKQGESTSDDLNKAEWYRNYKDNLIKKIIKNNE